MNTRATVWAETSHAKELWKSYRPTLLTPALENPKGQHFQLPNFSQCFKAKPCPEYKPTLLHWLWRILPKRELVQRDTTSILIWLTGRNFASEVKAKHLISVLLLLLLSQSYRNHKQEVSNTIQRRNWSKEDKLF